MQPTSASSRRQFFKVAGAGAAASVIAARTRRAPAAAGKDKYPLTLGLASYTTRKLSLDETIAITKRLDLKYLCLKSFHLPMDATAAQCAEAAQKCKEAGITLYAGGVITMRNEAAVTQAFDYAKAAGMTTIVGAPSHDMLPLVDKMVKGYNIKVAIHNHGPGDKNFPTPESVYERVKNLDKRIGLCIDVGHTVRIGADLHGAVEQYAGRLHDIHIKDETEARPSGKTCEIGRGVIDILRLLRALIKIKYANIVAFEYEKDANEPVPGLAESVGYVRGVMATL